MVTIPPSYVADMVRRPTPIDACVVPGSTPVVSFGNPRTSNVATLGINPSSAEFLAEGQLLTGPLRRLHTLESLGAEATESMTDSQVAMLVEGCNGYFERRPYKWFDALESIVEPALGVSYKQGTVCHLDIVQWATDPVWSKIDSDRVRSRLLDEGAPFLQQQLSTENVRSVVVNGTSVWNQLRDLRLVEFEPVDRIAVGRQQKKCVLYVGEGCGARFVGWSMNVQGNHASHKTRALLAQWLRSVVPAATNVEVIDTEYLGKTTVTSKSQFVEVLRSWCASSTAETIGDVGSYGGRPLISLELCGGRKVILNADTKRAAVEQFLAVVAERGAESAWTVLTNQKGVFNKVGFRSDGSTTPGWYCYLVPPAEKRGVV